MSHVDIEVLNGPEQDQDDQAGDPRQARVEAGEEREKFVRYRHCRIVKGRKRTGLIDVLSLECDVILFCGARCD
jgi:hypothetical protein